MLHIIHACRQNWHLHVLCMVSYIILVLGLSYDIVLQIGPTVNIQSYMYTSMTVFAGAIQIFCMVGGWYHYYYMYFQGVQFLWFSQIIDKPWNLSLWNKFNRIMGLVRLSAIIIDLRNGKSHTSVKIDSLKDFPL